MNHEIAKELKELGFSQEIKAGGQFYRFIAHPRMGIPAQWALNTAFTDNNKDIHGSDEWVKAPQLSELIEACGKSVGLYRDGLHSYYAWKTGELDSFGGQAKRYLGLTPEEAVAKLWIALNSQV